MATLRFVYTDIARDGMLTGLNIESTVELAEATKIPLIASGGVRELNDISLLKDAFSTSDGSLMGAITGRAIYEGTLDFRAGQALFDQAA